jgi:uncharacterized membrane protein YeaQ/YmgE (transglycosylase-associated protein family)
MNTSNRILSGPRKLLTFVAMLACLAVGLPGAAAEAGLTEKANALAQDTSASVKEAGNSAAEAAKTLWQRIDAARLKNRTPDELVAWVIMGVLVGAVAGSMTKLKSSGAGQIGRFVWGLAGAFLGGIAVHVGQFNFGWGPVLIRYEELFFSLLGAILLVVLGKIVRSRMKQKPPAQ